MTFKALLPVAMFLAVGCEFAGGIPPENTAELPQWLIGSYSRGTRVENSITIESEDRAVRFESGNHYAYRTGSSWGVATYDVKVTASTVLFVNGPLRGKQLSLASVSSNCRIVELEGEELFRSDTVVGCPMRSGALTANECDTAGLWRKTMRSGTLAGELFEVAVNVSVESDGFFKRSQATTTCHSGLCRYDEALPVVGSFDELGPDLEGFEHVPMSGCAVPAAPLEITALPPIEVLLTTPSLTLPPVAPTAYGRCSSDEQCTTGRCGEFGSCTSICKFDVECANPGEGMIASCRSNHCVATCSTGNACPSGTACADGLCL